MTFPVVPLPPDASDQAVAIWREVAESLTIGDIEKLHDAIKDFILLSASDKKMLEDMASVLPYPGLPPMLITEIFSHPEATVGVIERLGKDVSAETMVHELGTAEQAIVLDALIAWLKSEQKLADAIKSDAKADAATSNPVDAALKNFIAAGGTQASAPLNLGSLQFLKNNAVALAGLNIADPTLLNQAYQIASHQLLITLLPEINTSNLAVHPSEQSRSETIQRHLVDEIRKALQDGAIPLNMQTFLVLWTAITLPPTLVNKTEQTDNQKNNPTATSEAIAATAAGSKLVGPAPIIASVIAALTPLIADENIAAITRNDIQTPDLAEQLGMLSYIYTQMAPYWSGPAAVSLMAATTAETQKPEQRKLESSVRAFAIALGALLNDVHFDKILTLLIKKEVPSISQEQLKIFIAAMKISILTNALVALQIVIQRKINGQFKADELLQLILGPPIDDRSDLDDLLKGLIKSIQAELRHIPKEKQAEFLGNLLSCYDENCDINALVDPAKQFLNLCDSTLTIDSASSTKG